MECLDARDNTSRIMEGTLFQTADIIPKGTLLPVRPEKVFNFIHYICGDTRCTKWSRVNYTAHL